MRVEVWFADEARIGQKNSLTRVWGQAGSRPVAPKDLGFTSAYVFGAVCPSQGKAAALIMPICNTVAMNRPQRLPHRAQAVVPVSRRVQNSSAVDGRLRDGLESLRSRPRLDPLPLRRRLGPRSGLPVVVRRHLSVAWNRIYTYVQKITEIRIRGNRNLKQAKSQGGAARFEPEASQEVL